MHRSEALKKVDLIINGARAKTHGDAYDTHTNIAAMWNILWRHKLKSDLTFEDMYKFFIVGKLVRDSQNPKNIDNPIDVIGYGALWAEGKDGKHKS